jgi:uroporphyrinogen III methyltransferase/synthase
MVKNNEAAGKVWLVGAGPGDAGLFTLKGDDVLRDADVVLFDNLAGRGVIARIPSDAEAVFVGKSAGNHALAQDEINALLVKKAREGKRVVRLKGGDPFLFGRGGEELEALKAAAVPFEVVPGVSSAFAVPAYAGIPLTHRECCSELHIITTRTERACQWEALVKSGGTFVFMMGSAELSEICLNLIKAGLTADTPAAICERGTTARQRNIVSTVKNIAREAEKASFGTPAIIVVGEVCSYSKDFSWVEYLPLAGKRIAITRPKERNAALVKALSRLGAEVIELPVIKIIPREDTPELDNFFAALPHPQGLCCIAFASPAGVDIFFDKLKRSRRDIRDLAGIRFAAIGDVSAAAIEAHGILVDIIPSHFSGEDLGRALVENLKAGEGVLLPRSSNGNKDIPRILKEAGIKYIEADIYDTVARNWDAPELRAILSEDLDWIVFTSRSGVENFSSIFGREKLIKQKALCIGEATADAARQYGALCTVAENATVESMIAKLLEN